MLLVLLKKGLIYETLFLYLAESSQVFEWSLPDFSSLTEINLPANQMIVKYSLFEVDKTMSSVTAVDYSDAVAVWYALF